MIQPIPIRRMGLLAAIAAAAGILVSLGPPAPQRAAPAVPVSPDGRAQFRILLGLLDPDSIPWDGSIRASGARLRSIQLWRPTEADLVESFRWKLTTRRLPPQGAVNIQAGKPGPRFDNGIFVFAEQLEAGAKFEVETAQGNFSFAVQSVEFGSGQSFLGGRATVERVPQMKEKPASFDALARPAGGDQVLLIEHSKSKKTWSPPCAASAVRQDVSRTTAAVDGQGRVWVIWSANAGGNFDPYARSCKGDYDVYLRRLRYAGKIGMDTPMPIAASGKFEARAGVAFGAENRIWVAYEESFPAWGKDFGAYESTGSGLYQGNTVRVKVLEGNRFFTTAEPLDETVKSAPQLEGFPRLATDEQGVVYLAYRVALPASRGPLGSMWVKNVAYFDGAEWKGPVFVPDSDNLLDNRPALVATGPGDLLVVGSTDHRLAVPPAPGGTGRLPDRFNNDLVVAELNTGARAQKPELTALAVETPEPPLPDVKLEKDQVAMMRSYRVSLGTEKLQLLRGEFHRHTANSGDGGRDGALIDAYYVPGRFLPLFSYERSVRYPEGHRNLVLARRGVRPLPRLPISAENSAPSSASDTRMFYEYLRRFDGIAAMHTSGTGMDTDWRDNDPQVEPVVEIYQGDRQSYERPDAPRSNNADDSIGGWRPLGFVSLALKKGYRLGFQASSDHISTHYRAGPRRGSGGFPEAPRLHRQGRPPLGGFHLERQRGAGGRYVLLLCAGRAGVGQPDVECA